MDAKVNDVLVKARENIIMNTDNIDTNDCLATIEMRVKDAVNSFYSYLDDIWCLHECGLLSDEEEEQLTRNAYKWFKE